MSDPAAVRFEEQQRGLPLLVVVVLAPIVALVWTQAVVLVATGEVLFGSDTRADRIGLWVAWLIVGVGVPVLVASLRLRVQVTGEAVHIRFRPFLVREVPLDQVARAEAVTYRPVLGYGGWGLRLGRGGRVVFSVRGDQAVQLELRDGRTVLIGSARPAELRDAIEAAATDAGIGLP